jgi:hypothetical protein
MQHADAGEEPKATDAAIARKFGDTELRTLRNIYGRAFAVGLPEHMKLSDVIDRMEQRGLWQLHQHYKDGSLERRIREAGG